MKRNNPNKGDWMLGQLSLFDLPKSDGDTIKKYKFESIKLRQNGNVRTITKDEPKPKDFHGGMYWDMLQANKNGMYVLKSVVHKELRRGSSDAIKYGLLLASQFGSSRLMGYGVGFEEIRDLELVKSIGNKKV